jgi:hypothetical protein
MFSQTLLPGLAAIGYWLSAIFTLARGFSPQACGALPKRYAAPGTPPERDALFMLQ